MDAIATTPAARLVAARDARDRSDYVFVVATAIGWLVLTCGAYIFYIGYRLVQRMREHNRRRLAFLEATTEIAWQRAVAQGRSEDLRPRFERVANDLQVMRRMSGDFRDPGIWLLLLFLGSTIVLLVMWWLLDVDLITHAEAEADAESQLAQLLSLLGLPAPAAPPAAPRKPPHRYALRILATVGTCGLYAYWWMADLMREGNDHFRRDWMWEDAILVAVS